MEEEYKGVIGSTVFIYIVIWLDVLPSMFMYIVLSEYSDFKVYRTQINVVFNSLYHHITVL